MRSFVLYLGTALNYRTKKLNLFGNYSLNLGNRQSFDRNYRRQRGSVLRNDQEAINDFLNQNLKLGLDLFLSPKSTLGFLVNGNFGQWRPWVCSIACGDPNSNSGTETRSRPCEGGICTGDDYETRTPCQTISPCQGMPLMFVFASLRILNRKDLHFLKKIFVEQYIGKLGPKDKTIVRLDPGYRA